MIQLSLMVLSYLCMHAGMCRHVCVGALQRLENGVIVTEAGVTGVCGTSSLFCM